MAEFPHYRKPKLVHENESVKEPKDSNNDDEINVRWFRTAKKKAGEEFVCEAVIHINVALRKCPLRMDSSTALSVMAVAPVSMTDVRWK